MAATFAEFLRWPAREIVRVVVFRPNLRLAGWTAVGAGAPNSYQISLPRVVYPTLVAGGLYRKCAGLTENGTALTERASLALVDANPSSWYWDAAAELLYVRTSTGSDPDLFTVYHAQVEFRVATTGIVLDLTDGDPSTGIYHHPWLTPDVPTVSSAVEDFFFGQKITATSQITVLNDGFLWYRLLANDSDYWWKNTRVRFYVGGRYNGQALTWSQYVPDLTMLVEDVACDDIAATFELKPFARGMHVAIPPTPFFDAAYPRLGEGVRGTRKWIGYGRATIRPDLTDVSGLGIWTIADAAAQTLYAVHAVNAIEKSSGARVGVSAPMDYTVDLTACTITIVAATYRWQDYDLEVDVTGKPDGAGGYLSTVGEITRDLLQTFARVATADLETAAFAQADLDASEELSIWLKDPRTLASVLASSEPGLPSLCGSVWANVHETAAGLWTIAIWTPQYDASTLLQLGAADFGVFHPEPTIEAVYPVTRVYFNRNHSTQEWPSESASDITVQYLANTVEPLERYTFLRNASDAETLAQRRIFMAAVPTLEIEFAERGSRLAQHLAGAKVLLTRNPAPSVTGQWTDKPFELIRLDRAPSLALGGRLADFRDIGPKMGEWKADAALDWSALTPTQRLEQPGFWCDDNGRADPADPASAGVSVWW
jgi:hypothetical protein